ncbi:hypothetical protein, partial [Streptomyces sparsus]
MSTRGSAPDPGDKKQKKAQATKGRGRVMPGGEGAHRRAPRRTVAAIVAARGAAALAASGLLWAALP